MSNNGTKNLSPRFVSYQDGQREQFVVVKQNIFPWIEKAPFERSGHSVLGAVEMDKEGLVKCHACGEWHNDISSHVAMSARNGSSRHTSMREYRIRHGVLSTTLASPPVAERRRQNGFKAMKGMLSRRPESSNRALRTKTELMQKNLGVSARCQDANLEARCRAQRLEDLQILASQLERTPTKEELADFVNKYGKHSLDPHSLRTLFDVPLSEVFLEAGIVPRIKGQNVYVRTPEQRKAYKREWLRKKRESLKEVAAGPELRHIDASAGSQRT